MKDFRRFLSFSQLTRVPIRKTYPKDVRRASERTLNTGLTFIATGVYTTGGKTNIMIMLK
jgi:hypothetical protein